MKLLTTVATAAALFAASLIPTAATAEPSRQSEYYHVIDITQTEFGFISDSVERDGNKRRNWMVLSLPTKKAIVSVLIEYDCAGNTARQIRGRIEEMGSDKAVEKLINETRTIVPGSRQADVRDVVCERKSIKDAGLVSVDAMTLVSALATHAEKAQKSII